MVQAEGLSHIGRGYEMERLSVADGGLYAEHDDTMRVQSDGTTILTIKYKGGILLGADSRSSNVSRPKEESCISLHEAVVPHLVASRLTIFSD